MKMRPYVFAGLAVCAIASSLAAQQTVTQEVRILPGGTAMIPWPVCPVRDRRIRRCRPAAASSSARSPKRRPRARGRRHRTVDPGVHPLRVMADGQGRFGFRDLPAGRFEVAATRPGWSTAPTAARGRAALPWDTLADGESVSGVMMPMWRFASIAGTVSDEQGEPIVNVPVRIFKRTLANGRTRLTPQSQDNTDDRGIYRVGMLEPGEYIVAVPMQQRRAGDAMIADGAREWWWRAPGRIRSRGRQHDVFQR